MSDLVPPNNQPKFEEPITGLVHAGSGDINILVSNLGGLVALIKRLIPNEQYDSVERMINSLRQLKLYQKWISELKFIHNMLHRLETGLALIESPIRIAVLQRESLNFYSVQESWRIAVLPQIRDIRHFASNEMKFLEEPRLVITGDKIVGPSWIVDLVVLQRDFETSLKEQNTAAMYDLSREILDNCREHLFRVDRRLLEEINKLDQLSDQVFKGIDNA